jgi:hypothetical protein
MTAPGRYAASDGSFAKSAGSAAARGGILIAIAIVIGFALLAWGFDGGDDDAAAGGGSTQDDQIDPGDDGDGDTTTTVPDDGAGDNGDGDTTTTVPDDGAGDNGDGDTTTPVELDDPSSIRVAVLNGTDVGGLAGLRRDTLVALNYVATAGNAAGRPDITDSKVYFVTGFADEAAVVAEALSGPASVLELAPDDLASLEDGELAEAASADIIVVLGTDDALK